MQPDVPGRFDAVRQQRIMRIVGAAAAYTATRHRANGTTVQPLRHAAGEGSLLRLRARQRTIKLSDC